MDQIIGIEFVIPKPLFKVCLCFASGFIAVAAISRGIKFAYHFYFITKRQDVSSESTESKQALSILKLKLVLNFIIPGLIIFLHIPFLSKEPLGIKDSFTWNLVKTLIMIFLTLLRTLTLREELQF